jgi:uncharacterized protein YjbJ (UPF0337 family)
MDWNRLEGNWKQMKGKVKEQWGKLTDDDLDMINGQREQLEGRALLHLGFHTRDPAPQGVRGQGCVPAHFTVFAALPAAFPVVPLAVPTPFRRSLPSQRFQFPFQRLPCLRRRLPPFQPHLPPRRPRLLLRRRRPGQERRSEAG